MSLYRLSILLVVVLWPAMVFGQQRSERLIVTLEQGGFAAFKTEVAMLDVKTIVEGKSNSLPLPFSSRVVRGDGNVLHRMLVDDEGRIVFVYDLVIAELESPKRFTVSARPQHQGFARSLRIQNPEAFRGINESLATTPTLTAKTEQQSVEDGETLALDLLVNEKLGVKVVDYITLASQRWLLSPKRPSQPARDFGLLNVELAVKNYELFIDEEPIISSATRRNCTGALIWFALPGQGRFIFSLVPYDGYDFRKVGMIENNRIVFSWKGKSYEWISREPIVGSGGAWNLWVLHEPEYQDRFMPPAHATQQTFPRRPRMYPNPVGITIPPQKRPDPTGLKPNQSERPIERIWVSIGGAKNLEELLPKK